MTKRPTTTLAYRRWRKFKTNRRGYYSLLIFAVFFGLSLVAELISNDKPYVVYYDSHLYFPMVITYPETVFGGDFETAGSRCRREGAARARRVGKARRRPLHRTR